MAAKHDFTDRFLKSIKAIKPAKLDANDKEIEAARPLKSGERLIIYDGVVPQFGIRITDKIRPDAIGAFVLVARFPGSDNPAPRRIGDYPSMPLAKAREIARDWREDIGRGIDPKVKQAERRRLEERRRADTFAACFGAFADDHLSTLRSGGQVKRAIEVHVLPQWGRRPLTEIRRTDVKDLIRSIQKDGPILANRLLAYLKKFFAWAVEEELIEASPAAAVKRPAKENTRDRVLTETEILALWRACEGLGAFGRAFRLMLTTGQRRSEVGSLAWAEIDRQAGVWRLPHERTKADREHEIPLSPLAIDIIEASPKIAGVPYVFSTIGRASRGKAAAANGVPLAGWSKAKIALDRAMLVELQKISRERGEEPPAALREWHLHDLRRSCATFLAKLGTDRIVISKILNHAEGGVTGVYDRHHYDHEKRRALENWGDRLRAIVDGGDDSNVVSLGNRRVPA